MTREILDRILKLLDGEKEATHGEKLAALRSALEIITQESKIGDDNSKLFFRKLERLDRDREMPEQPRAAES